MSTMPRTPDRRAGPRELKMELENFVVAARAKINERQMRANALFTRGIRSRGFRTCSNMLMEMMRRAAAGWRCLCGFCTFGTTTDGGAVFVERSWFRFLLCAKRNYICLLKFEDCNILLYNQYSYFRSHLNVYLQNKKYIVY